MLTNRRIWLAAIMGGFALLWGTSPAKAGFELLVTSSNGGNTGVIVDNGPGDLNPLAGVILYSDGLPGDPRILVNIQIGTSKPVIGSASDAQMDLSFNLTKAAGASDTVTVKLSDTDFTDHGSNGTLSTSIGATIPDGSTLTSQTFKASSNLDFDTSGFAGTKLSFTAPPTAVSGSTHDGHPPLGTYSMTQVVTVAFPSSTANIIATGDYHSQNSIVPEPTSMALAAIGALGIIAYGLRRRRTLGA
jgi:hypothetical protein